MSFIFRSFFEDFKLCDHQFKRRILKKLKENFDNFLKISLKIMDFFQNEISRVLTDFY